MDEYLCTGRKIKIMPTYYLLKGKVKPLYHPSVDTGDYIILINVDSILINETTKHYFVSKPGRPGRSLKIKNASDCLPKLIIERAVKRMLSETEAKRLMRRLKIYKDQNHIHQAQNPIELDLTNLYSSIQ